MQTNSVMPAAFIGHGSPMNALEINRFTSAWQSLGASIPRPRAVLAISAHWFINGSAVTAMPKPRVIHDFYGFPQALFDFDYPAPGSPEVADEIVATVAPAYVAIDRDSWGIDHGTWSVLTHMFPKADVPVLQLSIHAGEDAGYHFELGARLAPLRERGVFIVGSGNVVHNLRRLDWPAPDMAFDWAEDFDREVKEIMTRDPGQIFSMSRHHAYASAVPTPEHYLPLLYLAGLSSAAAQPSEVLVEGGTMGSLTMTSYVLGCSARVKPSSSTSEGAATVPDPDSVPPQSTNI